MLNYRHVSPTMTFYYEKCRSEDLGDGAFSTHPICWYFYRVSKKDKSSNI